MKTKKQDRETRLNELVETHNLALSLRRLREAGPYDNGRWKRALYHALGIAICADRTELGKIRAALTLP